MVKKAKIYTRTGDGGQTGLVGGQRLSKANELIDLYGTCDELNAVIGVVRSCLVSDGDVKRDDLHQEQIVFIQEVQSRLFDLGSLLACLPEEREKFKLPIIKEGYVVALEEMIDRLEEPMEEMRNFILPGGSIASAHAHVARTVCRRFERLLVLRSEKQQDVPEYGIRYINRLSDYFFSLSRFVNFKQGHKEIVWKPGK